MWTIRGAASPGKALIVHAHTYVSVHGVVAGGGAAPVSKEVKAIVLPALLVFPLITTCVATMTTPTNLPVHRAVPEGGAVDAAEGGLSRSACAACWARDRAACCRYATPFPAMPCV